MKLIRMLAIAALSTASSLSSHAAEGLLDLSRYRVAGSYALDVLNGTSGGISGLEASAITYAADRGTLFFVGDEGTGVIEISTTGQTLGWMDFDWAGTGSTKHDTEGLTYLGDGMLVVSEERLFDAYRFAYEDRGTAALAGAGVSISNANVGNSGLEGLSVDPRDGSFVAIKQEAPEDILAGNLSFGAGLSGSSTMSPLFDATLMGLSTLSDVQTLSPVAALAGTAGADHLLVLSLGSRRLVEVDRSGQVFGSFDLSGLLPHNAFEGVTVDAQGTIYLVAEQIQDGSVLDAASQLVVLTPVPEPGPWALVLGGLAGLGASRRRRFAALAHRP